MAIVPKKPGLIFRLDKGPDTGLPPFGCNLPVIISVVIIAIINDENILT